MDKRVQIKCQRCGKDFEMSLSGYRKRIYGNKDVLCRECMKQYLSDLSRKHMAAIRDKDPVAFSNRMRKMHDDYYNSLSDEGKEMLREKKRNGWKSRSDEEKEAHRQRSRDQWNNLSDEEKEKMLEIFKKRSNEYWSSTESRQKMSNRVKKYWMEIDDDTKKELVSNLSNRLKEWRSNLSDEEREFISKRNREIWDSFTEDKKNKLREILKEKGRKMWDNLSDEEKEAWSQRTRDQWNNMSEEEKYIRRNRAIKTFQEFRENATPEELHRIRVKSSNSSRNPKYNSLHRLFVSTFISSFVNYFYISSEYLTSNGRYSHSWDYAIFDENDDLVAVVDLDGAYYHADNCEYDGIRSKEEYDEMRGLSVPDDVKIFIINEHKFDDSFTWLKKNIALDFKEYNEVLCNYFRSIPFPYPHYYDAYLIKSYELLSRYKFCPDNYFGNNINNRFGDWLCFEFHHSIWHDHRKGDLDPYTAWQDDDILHELISKHIIFQSHINKNKILNGFNSSNIGTKIPFISGGVSKMLIEMFLNEYNTIFNPSNRYSGIMLGSISSGKKYIGYETDEIKLNESNAMISFLKKYNIKFDACVSLPNNINTYPALCTEITDVNLVGEFLERYVCEMYLFISWCELEQYKDDLVYTINTKKLNDLRKYIYLIKRRN